MNLSLKKNEVANLIKQNDVSVTFQRPKTTSRSYAAWENFSIVRVNNTQQELLICDNCKLLLVYWVRDGTTTITRHAHVCQGSATSIINCSEKQTKVTEYCSSPTVLNIPKRV